MRVAMRALCGYLLAFFILAMTVGAAQCPCGLVLYRQNFEDVTYPDFAGVRKGTDGADGFGLYIREGALVIDSYDDRKSYVILPCTPTESDYTIEYTFSFTNVISDNGYAAFMLTSRGDAPDNITSAVIRSDGRCDEFGTLGEDLKNNISSGEKVSVTIPVTSGTFQEMTVSCGGKTETVYRENITEIPLGNIGFVTRNASIKVYDVAVINGVEYDELLGELKDSSTWSDEKPYSYDFQGEMILTCAADGDGIPVAPATSDSTVFSGLGVVLSISVFAVVFKRYKNNNGAASL